MVLLRAFSFHPAAVQKRGAQLGDLHWGKPLPFRRHCLNSITSPSLQARYPTRWDGLADIVVQASIARSVEPVLAGVACCVCVRGDDGRDSARLAAVSNSRDGSKEMSMLLPNLCTHKLSTRNC